MFTRGKTTSQGWTIMMFTLSAGINCFIILKLYIFCITLISFDKCEHFCKWTARMVPLGTPAVAILYILTSHTRFSSWSFYRYRKRFGDLDHWFPRSSLKILMTGEIAKTRNLGFISQNITLDFLLKKDTEV